MLLNPLSYMLQKYRAGRREIQNEPNEAGLRCCASQNRQGEGSVHTYRENGGYYDDPEIAPAIITPGDGVAPPLPTLGFASEAADCACVAVGDADPEEAAAAEVALALDPCACCSPEGFAPGAPPT